VPESHSADYRLVRIDSRGGATHVAQTTAAAVNCSHASRCGCRVQILHYRERRSKSQTLTIEIKSRPMIPVPVNK